MKKFSKIIATVVAVCATCAMFVGCTKTDKDYYKNVSNYSFWDNKGVQAIAQYKYFDIMDAFLKDGVIANGHITKDGKIKRIAFIGWDGARADSLANILYDSNDKATNNNLPAPEFSGLNSLKVNGGKVYLAYCGGEKGKDTEQDTSTSSSWTSEFTGVWSNQHGVKSNDHTKNIAYKTLFLQYAELGLHTSLGFSWGDYFDIALKDEVGYLMEHPNVPLKYVDTDRKAAENLEEARINEKLKSVSNLSAQELAFYNAVANDKISPNVPYDSAMRDYILERIALGDDIVGGIFDSPDGSGHNSGFGNENNAYVNAVRNVDEYLYQILQVIKHRESASNEDWLVLVANDHGGSARGHGKQVYEHRTNWVACNKPIDNAYFGTGYNGFTEGN